MQHVNGDLCESIVIPQRYHLIRNVLTFLCEAQKQIKYLPFIKRWIIPSAVNASGKLLELQSSGNHGNIRMERSI